MTSGDADLVASLRAGLVEEAGEARRLAAAIDAIDFRDAEEAPRIRDLELRLDEFAKQLDAAAAVLGRGDAEPSAVLEACRQARAASGASWGALTRTLEGLCAALEAEQGARARDRMRLVEGLRSLARESAERARLTARVAELDSGIGTRTQQLAALRIEMQWREETFAAQRAEIEKARAELAAARAQVEARDASIERLSATLAEDGHRLVTRAGEMLARHPRLTAIVRAPVRFVSRLLHRTGR